MNSSDDLKLQCCLRQQTQINGIECPSFHNSHLSHSCKPILIQHCKDNAFEPQCVEFLHNLTAVDKETVGLIAQSVCGRENSHPACSCVNAFVPTGVTNPKAQTVFKCLDNACNDPLTGGWNPYDCQVSISECQITNPDLFIDKSDVEKIEIINRCGEICVGNSCNPTVSPNTTPPPSETENDSSRTLLIVTTVAAALIIIIIIFVIIAATNGKKIKK